MQRPAPQGRFPSSASPSGLLQPRAIPPPGPPPYFISWSSTQRPAPQGRFPSSAQPSVPARSRAHPLPGPLTQSSISSFSYCYVTSTACRALPVIRQPRIRENPAPTLSPDPSPNLQSHLSSSIYQTSIAFRKLQGASRHPPASHPRKPGAHPLPRPLTQSSISSFFILYATSIAFRKLQGASRHPVPTLSLDPSPNLQSHL